MKRIVQRDTEHLPDCARRYGEELGRQRLPQRTLGGRVAQIKAPERGPVRINEQFCRILVPRLRTAGFLPHARKTGDKSITQINEGLRCRLIFRLTIQRTDKHHGQRQRRQNAEKPQNMAASDYPLPQKHNKRPLQGV